MSLDYKNSLVIKKNEISHKMKKIIIIAKLMIIINQKIKVKMMLNIMNILIKKKKR